MAAVMQAGAFDFAVNLHRQACPLEQNGFSSPASILITLAMCLVGSSKNTLSEMGTTLFGRLHPSQLKEINPFFTDLMKTLNPEEQDDAFTLRSANRLYTRKDFKIKQSYKTRLQDIFKSRIYEADFANKADEERTKINGWVSQVTNGKIRNLIPSGVLNQNTALLLVNALYLKAKWSEAFEKEKTLLNQEFDNGQRFNKPRVSMMHTNQALNYMETSQYQLLQLPYAYNTASMIILLPNRRLKLKDVVKNLNGKTLKASIEKLDTYQVDVKLPKFKIENQFDLIKVLQKLGIRDAFDSSKADFSEIAEVAKMRNLYISQVLHKAYIDVSENGTEAAAATAVGLSNRSGGFEGYEPKTFVANRPFLFAILDGENKHVLFMGQFYGTTSAAAAGRKTPPRRTFG